VSVRSAVIDRVYGQLVKEALGAEKIRRCAVGGEVHRDHDLGADLRHHLGGLSRRDREVAAGRYEEHIDRSELGQLFLGEQVTQVAEVADVHAVDLDREDHVLSALRPPGTVVERSDPGHQQVAVLVFARTRERQVRGDRSGIGMVGVSVGDREEVNLVLARHEPGRGGTRIGDGGRLAALQTEARTPVPGDLHGMADATGKARAPVPAQ